MSIPTMQGIEARTISSKRLTTRVLFSHPQQGTAVLFLHGNTSSATWWEGSMRVLPQGFYGIAPDQRGFGDADPQAKIDARRGMGDLTDDALALMDALGIEKFHLVGHSLGGSVVWNLLLLARQRLLSVTQVAPGSPYGFGGTKDERGSPCFPDFAGSGGGLANPELIRRIKENDRSLETPFSPRAVMRTLIFKPPFIAEREEELLSAMLAMHIGERANPGEAVRSPNWPYVAPGEWGAANALSPKYAIEVEKLYEIEPKPVILWVRGENDLLVSDRAASDPAVVGMLGLLPGWPGEEVYPPQPMLKQIRTVLEKYSDAGGKFQEVVIPSAGHTPYIEKPEQFNMAFHRFLVENPS